MRHGFALMIRTWEAKKEQQTSAPRKLSWQSGGVPLIMWRSNGVSGESPNDEMKGGLSAKDAISAHWRLLTGIDLIIDDTPEAVILSGLAPSGGRLPVLLEAGGRWADSSGKDRGDGRKAQREWSLSGKASKPLLCQCAWAPSELIKLLGQLRFRTSYGQNVPAFVGGSPGCHDGSRAQCREKQPAGLAAP